MNAFAAAKHYAADYGWLVFPLKPRDKRPLSEHGFLDGTTNAIQIKTWFTQIPTPNVGIVTGRKSGVFVLDEDGPEGAATIARLESEHGDIRTLTSNTGSGGKHRFFKMPVFDVRNKTRILPGIDIRGDGGYVVGPPSIHPNGTAYAWVNESLEITDAPDWLLDLLTMKSDQIVKPPAPIQPSANGHTAYVQRAFNDEIVRIVSAKEGERNDTLNKAAYNLGQLVGAGVLDRYAVEQALIDAALRAGLEERETRATARSGIESGIAKPRQLPEPNGHRPSMASVPEDAGRASEMAEPIAQQSASDTSYLIFFPLTDRGNAECLARLHGDQLRYEYTGRKWRVWDEQRWTYDTLGEADRQAVDVARKRREAFNAVSKVDEKAWQFALRSENQRNVRQMLESAQSLVEFATRIAQYDTNHYLACAGDVTLDLNAVESRSPAREDYITLRLGPDYDDEATCPRWRQFMREIFEDNAELIRYIQRAWGYSLTGDTREQKLFLCHGTGANGKSTFLSVLSRLLGEYAGATSFETFDAETNEARTDLAKLRGCRVVTVIEADEDARLNEARVKTITGCDKITARELYANSFDYIPTYKIWLAMNHKPIIRGTDNGIWRRIQLIPFTQNFESRKDMKLDQKLFAELPGVLNWALDGLRMWHGEGLNPPPIVTAATEEYRRESDVIGQWIEACCTVAPGREMGATSAYTSYKAWADTVGMHAMSMTSWGRKMTERGLEKGRRTAGANVGGVVYFGIGLLNNPLTN